jgi:hypothetical protein
MAPVTLSIRSLVSFEGGTGLGGGGLLGGPPFGVLVLEESSAAGAELLLKISVSLQKSDSIGAFPAVSSNKSKFSDTLDSVCGCAGAILPKMSVDGAFSTSLTLKRLV